MDTYINALGLLGLTISANYTGDLFNCKIREQLTNSPLVKHGTAFLILLFFIVLTSKDSFLGNVESGTWVTFKMLWSSALIYMIFILLTKCEYTTAIVIIAILVFIMFLNIEKSNKDEKTQKTIDDIKDYSYLFAGIALLYGVHSYYQKQVQDHPDFSLYKFFLGTTKCSTAKV